LIGQELPRKNLLLMTQNFPGLMYKKINKSYYTKGKDNGEIMLALLVVGELNYYNCSIDN